MLVILGINEEIKSFMGRKNRKLDGGGGLRAGISIAAQPLKEVEKLRQQAEEQVWVTLITT